MEEKINKVLRVVLVILTSLILYNCYEINASLDRCEEIVKQIKSYE